MILIFTLYYRFHSQNGKPKSKENILKDVYPTRLLPQKERLRGNYGNKSVTADCICNLCNSAIKNEEIYDHFNKQHKNFRQINKLGEKIWTLCFKCRPFLPIRGNEIIEETDQKVIMNINTEVLCTICNQKMLFAFIFQHLSSTHFGYKFEDSMQCFHCESDASDEKVKTNFWENAAKFKFKPIRKVDNVRVICNICNNMISKSEQALHFNYYHISFCIYFNWKKCSDCDWLLGKRFKGLVIRPLHLPLMDGPSITCV